MVHRSHPEVVCRSLSAGQLIPLRALLVLWFAIGAERFIGMLHGSHSYISPFGLVVAELAAAGDMVADPTGSLLC